MSCYLYLPQLRVQTANAQACSFVVNSAPIMALMMFAHNLERSVTSPLESVSILHHDSEMLGEYAYGKFYPQQRRGSSFINKDDYSQKNKNALSLQPTSSCHLLVSLILKFGDEFDPSPLELFLKSAKIAGGNVISYQKPIFGTQEDIRKHLIPGFWLVERQDLLHSQTRDPLDQLIFALGHEHEQDKLKWLTPSTLGYTLVTPLKKKNSARGGYPHAFAEPLIGLVQYSNFNNFNSGRFPMWHHKWINKDTFVVTQIPVKEKTHDQSKNV